MKHLYLALATGIAMSLQAAPPMAKQLSGEKRPADENRVTMDYVAHRVPMRVTVDELFACPENTVLDGPFRSEEVGYQGFQSSDQGRPGMPTKYYQAFHGCLKSVNAVRVIGMFNYFDDIEYNWYGCDSRGGMQEDYTLSSPETFEISFYRMGEDGFPGECVYTKNIDITGRYLGMTYGSGPEEMPLYEFMAELGEDVRLESGFMSFSAVDKGDSPTCWFGLFTADTSLDYGCIEMSGYGMQYSNLPSIFSLMGSGAPVAGKALRVDRITSPLSSGSGTHQSVTVKIRNVGADIISDATLELWLDGKLVSKEEVCQDLPSGEDCNYTFTARVDLSTPGEHLVEVRNVTPGDENVSLMSGKVATYTYAEGESCVSSSEYFDETIYISRVKIGTIDNESGPDQYEDYTSECVTEIRRGETLTLEVEPLELVPVGVWVDWNNDGRFDGEGEYMGYIADAPLEISIPEGIAVTEGIKRMRLVMDYGRNLQPCGIYYYGETEDYGINVVRNADTPSLAVDLNEISETAKNDVRDVAFALMNQGETALDARLKVAYSIPVINEPRKLGERKGPRPVAREMKRVAGEDDPAAESETRHVLRYDGGFQSSVALGNYSTAVFAHYYPASLMKSIAGMQLSSVDVYLNEVPSSTRIIVYGQGEDGKAGEVLATQDFAGEAGKWNHVVLDSPVAISGEDLWFGIEMKDMEETGYYIGIDGGPALAGYGDLCNVGGDMWWSMMELGINSNLCIRGNVSGNPSPALSWLTLDKENVSVSPSGEEKVVATLNAGELKTGVYEAAVVIESNDELRPVYSVPVYLSNGVAAGVDASRLTSTHVKIESGKVVITSEDNIMRVEAYSVAGHKVASSAHPGCRHEVSLDSFGSAVYVFNVIYLDGTSETFKISVVR